MGLSEWWNRITGKSNDSEKTAAAEQPEEQLDDYQAQKADNYMEQRDPGVSGMGQHQDKEGF